VSFLVVTLPVTLLLAGTLLGLVVAAVRAGDFDDLEAPSARLLEDDDRTPELDGPPRPTLRSASNDRSQVEDRPPQFDGPPRPASGR